jgi:hypothetical protein
VLTDTPRRLGEPATVVYASALSEDAIVAGLASGRVHGRNAGPDGPEIDMDATGVGRVVMGQSLPAGRIRVVATIRRARAQHCEWIVRGRTVSTAAITSNDARLAIDLDLAAGDWVSVLVRQADRVTAWSNAIYVDPPM